MTGAEIIRMIQDCKLQEARRHLRKYAKTNDVARKAVGRLNNLINGVIDDVHRSTSNLAAILWHENFEGPGDTPRLQIQKGWYVESHGVGKGFVVRYGPKRDDGKYVTYKATREDAVRYALEHRHEIPHYDEQESVAWLKLNRFYHLVPMAKLKMEETA